MTSIFGNVGHAREQVPLHVRVHHLPGVAIEDAILEQREVERPDDAAVDLALGRQPVDDQPAVLDREDARHLDDAGLDVDVRLRRTARRSVVADDKPGLPVAVDRDRLRCRSACTHPSTTCPSTDCP